MFFANLYLFIIIMYHTLKVGAKYIVGLVQTHVQWKPLTWVYLKDIERQTNINLTYIYNVTIIKKTVTVDYLQLLFYFFFLLIHPPLYESHVIHSTFQQKLNLKNLHQISQTKICWTSFHPLLFIVFLSNHHSSDLVKWLYHHIWIGIWYAYCLSNWSTHNNLWLHYL